MPALPNDTWHFPIISAFLFLSSFLFSFFFFFFEHCRQISRNTSAISASVCLLIPAAEWFTAKTTITCYFVQPRAHASRNGKEKEGTVTGELHLPRRGKRLIRRKLFRRLRNKGGWWLLLLLLLVGPRGGGRDRRGIDSNCQNGSLAATRRWPFLNSEPSL